MARIKGKVVAGLAAAAIALATLALVAVGLVGDEAAPEREPLISGVSVGVSPQTTLDARDYDKVDKADVEVIRIPLNWSHVQAAPGDCQPAPAQAEGGACNWVTLDAAIGNAAESGARVLPILSDVPGWVAKHTTKPPLSGEDRAGWEDFVDAAVRRYGHGGAFWEEEFTAPPYEGNPHPIAEWQIWNEPNGKVYFHPRPNARKYAYLVGLTADVIRGVDPEAEVVLAGMFGTAEIPLRRFLRDLYATRGAKRDFDSIALHPYSRGVGELKLQIRWARREAKRAGDADVGLWITELGWGSKAGDHPLEKGRDGQAKLLLRAFELLGKRRQSWNVEGVIWFTWQDRRDRQVCQFCRSAGLFDSRGRSKPAFAAFQQATGG